MVCLGLEPGTSSCVLTSATSYHCTGAEAAPLKGLEALLWYGLLVVNHLLWGLFPVSCRYLQTRAQPPLESMRLGFYVAAIAAVGLFTTYTVPVELARRCCKKEIGLEEVRADVQHANCIVGPCSF